MITNCILLYAIIINNFAVGIPPTISQLEDLKNCGNYVPSTSYQYATLIIEYFDEKNIETATKVMWCESRNKTEAFRYQDFDSGLFQVIPSTWGWVKQKHDIPYWDYPINNSYAQHIPKYNIEVAALLVQDMHTRDNYWQPWNSSKFCWENTDEWIKRWQNENW